MQNYNDIQQRQRQSTIERNAQAIFDHIVSTYNRLMGMDPIEDLSDEDLITFLDTEFDRCGLNYMMLENFDSYGSTSITLNLETNAPFQSPDEVTAALKRSFETYLEQFERDCQKCKAIILESLRAYQDQQNRKKQRNPYSS